MTTFADGPAKGTTLILKHSPEFLRAVESGGQWDALDLPDDTPDLAESLHAYRRNGNPTWIHILAKKGGGFFTRAEYHLATPQPDDATMRSTDKWQAWTQQQTSGNPK